MRDLGITFLFLAIIYFSFRRPFIGVSAWIWVALAYPAGWAWGFSTNFRINFTVAILTYFSYLIMKNKPKFKLDSVSVWLILFWICAAISTFITESLLDEFAWNKFIEFSKVLMLYFAVVLIINKKINIDTLIWSIVLAVSGYAAMEAFKFIVSGGSHRVAGFSGHILGDRNDLVVAINMCLPLILYLRTQTKVKILNNGLSFLFLFNIIAVIGSYSRAGFIGLVVLGFYYFIKSNKKIVWTLVMCILIPIFVSNAPEEWSDRMNTVSSATSQDNSFIGRLWAWKISVKIANDNFFGNSFLSTQDPLAWQTYRMHVDYFGPITTPPIPPDQFAKAAHNIYFQVLGDLGYIGLIIYLLILWLTYRRLAKLIKLAKRHGIEWVEKLSSMLMVSLVAYGITGANVSLAYFELLYVIVGISYVLKYRVLAEIDQKQGSVTA